MTGQMSSSESLPPDQPKKTHHPSPINERMVVYQTESQPSQPESETPPVKAHELRRLGSSSSKSEISDGGEATVSGRERLKRHRVEVAGRVWIPDIWGQEELLKDWIDCTAFDASLVRSNIMSARAALVEEGRRIRASPSRVRI